MVKVVEEGKGETTSVLPVTIPQNLDKPCRSRGIYVLGQKISGD